MSSNSNSNSNSASSSSDKDYRNPNSDSDPDPELETEPEPEPEANASTDLIDQSLDALENQLASISMSSRSPTATLDDEEELQEEEEDEQLLEEPIIRNGSLSEEIGAENEHTEIDWKAESSGVIKDTISSEWRNVLEVDEVGRPLSPGSSGYAGERGSTSGGDEINDDDEDNNEIREVQDDGVSGSHDRWVSGKRHPDEVSWSFSSFPYLIWCSSCTYPPFV